MITQDDQLIFRCFECKKNYEKDFNKALIKRFANIYEFCNEDIVGKDLMKHNCLIKKLFIVV